MPLSTPPGHTVCCRSSFKTSHQARLLQGHIGCFHPFHRDRLKREDGKDTKDQKLQELVEAQSVVNTAPEKPLWEGDFFEMRLKGDRQHLHEREILLMELEKYLASTVPSMGLSGRCSGEEGEEKRKVEEKGEGRRTYTTPGEGEV